MKRHPSTENRGRAPPGCVSINSRKFLICRRARRSSTPLRWETTILRDLPWTLRARNSLRICLAEIPFIFDGVSVPSVTFGDPRDARDRDNRSMRSAPQSISDKRSFVSLSKFDKFSFSRAQASRSGKTAGHATRGRARRGGRPTLSSRRLSVGQFGALFFASFVSARQETTRARGRTRNRTCVVRNDIN